MTKSEHRLYVEDNQFSKFLDQSRSCEMPLPVSLKYFSTHSSFKVPTTEFVLAVAPEILYRLGFVLYALCR